MKIRVCLYGVKVVLPRSKAKKHLARLARDARKRKVREAGRHDRWWPSATPRRSRGETLQ